MFCFFKCRFKHCVYHLVIVTQCCFKRLVFLKEYFIWMMQFMISFSWKLHCQKRWINFSLSNYQNVNFTNDDFLERAKFISNRIYVEIRKINIFQILDSYILGIFWYKDDWLVLSVIAEMPTFRSQMQVKCELRFPEWAIQLGSWGALNLSGVKGGTPKWG